MITKGQVLVSLICLIVFTMIGCWESNDEYVEQVESKRFGQIKQEPSTADNKCNSDNQNVSKENANIDVENTPPNEADKGEIGSSEDEQDGGKIRIVPKLEILEDFESICKSKGEEFDTERKKLKRYAKSEVISMLEYVLQDERYWEKALYVIRYDFPDLRISKAIIEEIWKRSGKRLFRLVDTAYIIASDDFLPCILERAIDDSYVHHTWYFDGRRNKPSYESVYSRAARLLFKITKGKIGIENIDKNQNPMTKERKENIRKWKEWWDTNKHKYKK